MKVSMPVEAANAVIRSGSLPKTMQSILADLKPEAAYFCAYEGRRTGFLFVDMQDVSQIPALAEPWFLALNATVDFYPVMTSADLAKAQPGIDAAVKKYT